MINWKITLGEFAEYMDYLHKIIKVTEKLTGRRISLKDLDKEIKKEAEMNLFSAREIAEKRYNKLFKED